MGRCGSCRKQTQFFCYVHQTFVCTECVVTAPLHQWCVIGSYRKWVQDSNYQWPPRCPVCRVDFDQDDPDPSYAVRLPCLHLVRRACLVGLPEPRCPICSEPFLPAPDDTSALATRLRAAVANAPWAVQDPPNDPAPPAVDPAPAAPLPAEEPTPPAPPADPAPPAEPGPPPAAPEPEVSETEAGDTQIRLEDPQTNGSAMRPNSSEPAIISAPARANRLLEGSVDEKARRYRKMMRKASIEASRRWRLWKRHLTQRKELVLLGAVSLLVIMMVLFYLDGEESSRPAVRAVADAEHRMVNEVEERLRHITDSESVHRLSARVRETSERIRDNTKRTQQSYPNAPTGMF